MAGQPRDLPEFAAQLRQRGIEVIPEWQRPTAKSIMRLSYRHEGETLPGAEVVRLCRLEDLEARRLDEGDRRWLLGMRAAAMDPSERTPMEERRAAEWEAFVSVRPSRPGAPVSLEEEAAMRRAVLEVQARGAADLPDYAAELHARGVGVLPHFRPVEGGGFELAKVSYVHQATGQVFSARDSEEREGEVVRPWRDLGIPKGEGTSGLVFGLRAVYARSDVAYGEDRWLAYAVLPAEERAAVREATRDLRARVAETPMPEARTLSEYAAELHARGVGVRPILGRTPGDVRRLAYVDRVTGLELSADDAGAPRLPELGLTIDRWDHVAGMRGASRDDRDSLPLSPTAARERDRWIAYAESSPEVRAQERAVVAEMRSAVAEACAQRPRDLVDLAAYLEPRGVGVVPGVVIEDEPEPGIEPEPEPASRLRYVHQATGIHLRDDVAGGRLRMLHHGPDELQALARRSDQARQAPERPGADADRARWAAVLSHRREQWAAELAQREREEREAQRAIGKHLTEERVKAVFEAAARDDLTADEVRDRLAGRPVGWVSMSLEERHAALSAAEPSADRIRREALDASRELRGGVVARRMSVDELEQSRTQHPPRLVLSAGEGREGQVVAVYGFSGVTSSGAREKAARQLPGKAVSPDLVRLPGDRGVRLLDSDAGRMDESLSRTARAHTIELAREQRERSRERGRDGPER